MKGKTNMSVQMWIVGKWQSFSVGEGKQADRQSLQALL